MDRTFVDQARIFVAGGDGGHGATSFLREKYRPKGRPDGGSGGDGGSVILRVERNVATLAELARSPHQRAGIGKSGSGQDKHGASGDDRVLLIPEGVVVRDQTGQIVADLVGDGSEFVVARGGRGGRGNAALATARRRAPGFAERGEPGEQGWLTLELKVLADVGLVGFPNAGKSSLIAKLSAARPKIAAYPFTTLSPNLGVAETADARFVIADVPGLIEGASEGRGLGLAFLRHLERCRVLCFVLDLAAEVSPSEQLASLRRELTTYSPSFDERPGVVAANKIDVGEAHLENASSAARDAGFHVTPVSALTGQGTEELSRALVDAVRAANEATPLVSHTLIKLRPQSEEVIVEREGEGWRVRSARAERLLARFDVGNADALAYIQDRLVSYGVEEALARAGARAGDDVRIGEMVLEYTPEDESEPTR